MEGDGETDEPREAEFERLIRFIRYRLEGTRRGICLVCAVPGGIRLDFLLCYFSGNFGFLTRESSSW